MEANFLTAVFLPLALFIIMLGIGLTLTLEDFKRVESIPKRGDWLSGAVDRVADCGLGNSDFECGSNGFRFCDRYFNPIRRKTCYGNYSRSRNLKWDTGDRDRFYTYAAEYSDNGHCWDNLWSANVCDWYWICLVV